MNHMNMTFGSDDYDSEPKQRVSCRQSIYIPPRTCRDAALVCVPGLPGDKCLRCMREQINCSLPYPIMQHVTDSDMDEVKRHRAKQREEDERAAKAASFKKGPDEMMEKPKSENRAPPSVEKQEHDKEGKVDEKGE